MGWRRLVRRRLIVNTKSGTAVTGVLRSSRGGVLELVDAAVLNGDGSEVKADGALYVDLTNVDYCQTPKG